MATAKCSKCGNTEHWYAGRGQRLSDQKSSCCNAPMEGLTAGKENKYKGRHYEKCVICGSRGMVGAWCGIVFPQVDFQTSVERPGQDPSVYNDEFTKTWTYKVFPKGSPIHSHHFIMPADRVFGDMTEEEIEAWKAKAFPYHK